MQNRRLHGAWFALAVVPVAVGALLAVRSVTGVMSDFRSMPRLVLPGEKTLTLDAGDYVGYAESSTIVDGKSYDGLTMEGQCSLRDVSTGATLDLTKPSSSTTYNLGSYSGNNAFEVTIPHDGDYVLACEGHGVVAIGHGFVTRILVGVLVPGFAGFLGAGLLALMIHRVRGRSAPAA